MNMYEKCSFVYVCVSANRLGSNQTSTNQRNCGIPGKKRRYQYRPVGREGEGEEEEERHTCTALVAFGQSPDYPEIDGKLTETYVQSTQQRMMRAEFVRFD